MAQAVFFQRALDGFCRVLALWGTTGARELLPLDDPKLLSIVEPANEAPRFKLCVKDYLALVQNNADEQQPNSLWTWKLIQSSYVNNRKCHCGLQRLALAGTESHEVAKCNTMLTLHHHHQNGSAVSCGLLHVSLIMGWGRGREEAET